MMHTSGGNAGWLALLLAGLLEVSWAISLKYSDGFTRFWPSLGMVMAIVLSFGLLAVSLKSIPFGTAYAVWTGIGAAGAMIIGMAAFGESTDLIRLTCLSLIIVGQHACRQSPRSSARTAVLRLLHDRGPAGEFDRRSRLRQRSTR